MDIDTLVKYIIGGIILAGLLIILVVDILTVITMERTQKKWDEYFNKVKEKPNDRT